MIQNQTLISFATGGLDNDIKIWNPIKGTLLHSYHNQESQINSLEFTSDGRALAAGGFGKIKIYDYQFGSSAVGTISTFSKNVNTIGFNGENSWMFAGGEDKTANVIDWKSSAVTRTFDCGSSINSMVLHNNQNDLIIGLENGKILVWNVNMNKPVHSFFPDPLGGPIYSLALNSDGTSLAAINAGGNLMVWSLAMRLGITFADRHRSRVHSSYGLKVKFSPDETLIATCGADGYFNLLKTANLASVFRTQATSGRNYWVWDCAFSADSRYLLTASSDSLARLWNLNTCEERISYKGHKKAITCLAFLDKSMEEGNN